MRRKRNNEEEYDTTDRWLVSYADFITLLFAFFVVMYAISSVNDGKYRVMADSFIEAFNDPNKTLAQVQADLDESQAGVSDQWGVVDLTTKPAMSAEQQKNLNQKNIAEETQSPSASKPHKFEATTDSSLATEQQAKQLEDIVKDINQVMSQQIDEDVISVRNSDDFIEVEIKNNVLFPSGSARLQTSAVQILSRLADIFATFDNLIQVEGFTDNKPINTLAFPSNWELSAARAASVVHLLMKSGLEPGRMVAIGYGEHRPIADNATEEGRQKNRRVVIVIPTADTGGHIIDSQQNQQGWRGPSGQKRVLAE